MHIIGYSITTMLSDCAHLDISAFQFQIKNQIEAQRLKTAIANRKRLEPVIKTIIFCGRNGLPLRGHRDTGREFSLEEPTESDGNFRSLLRFRADSGDTTVSDIVTAPKNARYLHPEIQNELIDICGDEIMKKIVAEIKECKYFAVLADETTDVSGKEQLNVCIRYYAKGKICEDFLRFTSMHNVTGQAIAEEIEKSLTECGLDPTNLVGQGYDGASSMSGCFNGAQSHLIGKYPTAIYVHCAAHCLNLALAKGNFLFSFVSCIHVTIAIFLQVPMCRSSAIP